MFLCVDESPFLKSAFLYDDATKKVEKWVIDNKSRPQIKDNIYFGKIVQWLPQIEGAFVDIGLAQNAFFKFNDLKRVYDLKTLKKGDFVFGQVSKEPYQTKGAQLTTDLSVRGHFAVYLPFASGVKISRKIERSDLLTETESALNEILCDGDGVIVRTQAKGNFEALLEEVKLLKANWLHISRLAMLEKKYRCVHDANDYWLEVMELVSRYDVDKILLQESVHEDILKGYGVKRSKIEMRPVGVPCYEQAHLNINDFLKQEVFVDPSGLSIVLNELEAFTIIDINSDKFTLKKQGNLALNEMAVPLIASVLAFRRISGVILIDFLTLTESEQKQMETATLHKIFPLKDGYKGMGFTRLGLYELTKKREQPSLRDLLSLDFRANDLAFWHLHEIYFELKRMAHHTNTKKVTLSLTGTLYEWVKNQPPFNDLPIEVKLALLPEINGVYRLKTLDNNSLL